MPTYNHSRSDSHLTPCPICAKEALVETLLSELVETGVCTWVAQASVDHLVNRLTSNLPWLVNREAIHPDTPMASLPYLIEVAQKTEGADVWRALFAEMLKEVTSGNT